MTNEEAVKMLRTMQRTVYLGNRKFEDAIECAIKALSEPLQPWEVLAAQSVLSQSVPHWIPVTERLPEKSGEYLVTVKWVTGDCDVDVYEYDARHKTWNDGESAGGERAVAWCNRPKPYKGVTE